MADPIRVLVVDDSAFMRSAIRSMLRGAADIEIVGTAADGEEAIERAAQLKPDVVTLDIEMPKLDGLSALPRIRSACDASVIMVSSLTVDGSHAALSAMRRGAADVIAKDSSQVSLNIGQLEGELTAKIRAVAKRKGAAAQAPPPPPAHTPRPDELRARRFDVVLIGSSTGGPPVLETLLGGLPADFPLPIVVAQHMPRMFTGVMAERLDEMSGLSVHHATCAMPLLPGHVYIAPGGEHARIARRPAGGFRVEISARPADALYKPSVDVLIGSAAEVTAARTLAIVLTGMGEDGLAGARKLVPAGGVVLAQEASSCVVYGMPKAVTQAGLTAGSLNPDQLRDLLAGWATQNTPANPAIAGSGS